MNDETTQSLKKLWEDNAYPSATPLYKLAKRRGLNVRIVDVENWLKNRASTSLLQQRKEPYAVAGSFDNATKSLERVYLDLLDRSTHTSPDGFNYLMIAVDSFTRKAWGVPMKSKLPTEFFDAYLAIEKQMKGKPVLLFVDNEGASLGENSKFQLHLQKHKVILKRKQGRNDLAPIDAFMGMLGRTVSKMRMERDLPESAWKTLSLEAIPLLNDRSMKRLDGSSPNDVQDAIKSEDPKDKVLEFKRLKATAEGLETNHDEHASIVKKLEAAKGFRVPTTYRTGRAHGMTKIGEKTGTVKWENKIRKLKDGKVHMGMAIDADTNEEWPAKLVQAVNAGADVPGEVGTEKTIADSKRQKYIEAFQPFVTPAKRFLRRNGGNATFSELGTFLGTVEGVKTAWGPELKKVTALTSRSMITPFLESFPEDFSVEVDGDTYTAKLAGNEVAERAQPAKRKTPSSSTVKGKILTIKRAGVGTKRTTTRTRRILK